MTPAAGLPAYVGYWKSCDCVAAAVLDNPEHVKDTAKEVARYIRRGYRVVRIDATARRMLTFHCNEHPEGTPAPWELEKVK